jgi:hypothetical protein
MSLWPHGIVSSAITKHLMGASSLGSIEIGSAHRNCGQAVGHDRRQLAATVSSRPSPTAVFRVIA